MFIIRVDNIAPNYTTKELRECFGPMGSIKSRLFTAENGLSSALVMFKTPEQAKAAIANTNGRMIYGRPFVVREGTAKDRELADLLNKERKGGSDRGRGGFGGRGRGMGRGSEPPDPSPGRGRGADLHRPSDAHPPARHPLPQLHGGQVGVPQIYQPLPFDKIADLTVCPFYIIQFETALDLPLNNVPFEVSVLRFTLKDGEIQHYHNFIDTGPLPHCHTSDLVWRSEEVVGLPIGKLDHAEKNYKRLWADICDVLRFPVQEKWTHEIVKQGLVRPYLYAKQPSKAAQCIQWLSDKAGSVSNIGDVKPLEELIWYLSSIVKKSVVPTSQIENYFSALFTQDRSLALPPEAKCPLHRKVESERHGSNYRCTLFQARQFILLLKKIFEVGS